MKFLAITTALVLCILSTASVAADGTEGSAWGYKRNDPSMASPEQWSEHYPTGDCTDYNLTQSSESFKDTVNSGSCAVSANNATYNMLQFHLHAPLEHTLNGEHLDGEVHFVHSNTDGSTLLVVGVFFKAVDGGGTDPWVASVLDALDTVSMNATVGMSTTSYADAINAAADANGVFNYAGSLTTPACSEIVDWWVVKQPVKLSVTDLGRLQSQLKELPVTDDGKNACPVHPLNGRVVTAYA
ncbi:hypothetical protein JG688_00015135 [Phytophthora aleatoria]|uniref:Alpha-carbonic anhydrase domain-containing protein n=1 Tax=Phytophthora aleatoria TaxID=2496075 RepID=A0A8J5IIE4_9STRA|nr:hypothetical protein JG688_00015135 [Phytophthora aleatoria]